MSTEEVIDNLLTQDQYPKQETIDIVLPTYRVKPDENEKFYPSQMQAIAANVLKEKFNPPIDTSVTTATTTTNTTTTKNDEDDDNMVVIDAKMMEDWYDFCDEIEELSKDIADSIKERCKKELNLPRYKLIVQVTIGQRKDQGVRITSRCLWDTSTDNYASVNFQNEFIWVSALVFGLYTD